VPFLLITAFPSKSDLPSCCSCDLWTHHSAPAVQFFLRKQASSLTLTLSMPIHLKAHTSLYPFFFFSIKSHFCPKNLVSDTEHSHSPSFPTHGHYYEDSWYVLFQKHKFFSLAIETDLHGLHNGVINWDLGKTNKSTYNTKKSPDFMDLQVPKVMKPSLNRAYILY